MKRTKTYQLASFKALPDENGETGRFEAIVSVFNNVDLQGDRVVKGAFTKSLKVWRESGDPIPIIWSHDWGDPFANVGEADPALAEETDQGLKLVGRFDVHKSFAAQVYDLLKSRRVREWSFAYEIEEERPGKDRANDLVVLDIIEAGPTLKGANPDTATLSVKSQLEAAARQESEPKQRPVERKNVYTPISGSFEELQQELRFAVRGWSSEQYGSPWAADVCGTFADHVVLAIYQGGRDEYIQVPYTRGTDGVVFEDPIEVEITTTVAAKSAPAPAPAPAAKTEPLVIEERDDQFCVSDGTCYDTREKAEDYIRTLSTGGTPAAQPAPLPPADEIKRLMTDLDLLLTT